MASTSSIEPKSTSSVHDIHSDTPPPFGSRYLTNEDDVWSKSAWDHVPPPAAQDELISSSLARQKTTPVPASEQIKINGMPARHWDLFYKSNTTNFFKDRKWLGIEFPELLAAATPEAGPVRVLEVGCGVGNSLFPILDANQNPHLDLYACDYSQVAINLLQSHDTFVNPRIGRIRASVWDLASHDTLPQGIEPGSVDVIVLIFVLSALHPNEWRQAVSNLEKLLRAGGRILFRDYGRYDMTQIRFKEGRMMADNFYMRGDKTRVYFFEHDELSEIFSKFKIEQLGVDRRLLLNRKRKVKMYRVWMQGKFVKE